MMRVLVVDGQLFGRDENSWVTYQLLYDHHCRPMVPVDDQYDGHSGSERFLAHAKSMQIDVIRRNELDWRDLGGRADATLVPVSTFHSVHGDRVRVRTPDPALNTAGRGAWGFDGDSVCWRGGRGVTLPMFQTCPTKLTEWLQRFTPPQPPNPETSGDSSPSQPRAAYTGASVFVVCKHGVILGKSRHTGLWEDFGGARDESKTERPYDTAVRELKEESGLEPRDLDFGQRDPIIVSHAGHVHAVFVARMIDTATAFVVEPSGRVQSTLATDGELSEFACLRSFDDYFASELNDQLIHRRIKDARAMELAASVYRGLQAAAEVRTDGNKRHGGGFTTALPSAMSDPSPTPAPAPAPAAPSATSDSDPAPAPAPPPAPAPASAPAPAPAPGPPATDDDDGHGSVCYTDMCSRPSRLTARLFDDDGVERTHLICCFQCVVGEGHSSECDGAFEQWRQRRLRRRLSRGVGRPARHNAAAPTSTAPTSTAP
jgi:8-oxo-dGTP pyrophosphatase MutT (NUDIX family)